MAARSASAAAESDRLLVLARRFKAPRETVFRAFTDPAMLAQWWGPPGYRCTKVALDPRPGRRYRIDMRAPDGAALALAGEYRDVEAPSRLVFTVVWQQGEMAGIETVVTIVFEALGPETALHLTHDLFPSVSTRDAHRGGWSASLDRLVGGLGSFAEIMRRIAMTPDDQREGPLPATADPVDSEIAQLERQIRALEDRLAGLRARQPRRVDAAYALADWSGRTVGLGDLFAGKDHLVLIHNMGKSCPYCTMWADGFNGAFRHVENHAAFVLASNDDVATQKALAAARGWQFRMVSAKGTTLFHDMGFADKDGGPLPGVSTFRKAADGSIERYTSASFAPGDRFCAVFSFLDMLPKEAAAPECCR